jgi:hypothetical protein
MKVLAVNRLLIAWALAVFAMMLIASSMGPRKAEANYLHGGEWAIWGRSFELLNNSGTESAFDFKDPVTLLFQAWKSGIDINAKGMLRRTSGFETPSGIPVPPLVPLYKISCVTRTYLAYYDPNRRLATYSRNGNNLTTRDTGCAKQWHIRLWTSKTHRSVWGESTTNDWAVGAPHHEEIEVTTKTVAGRTVPFIKHKRDTNFEQGARKVIQLVGKSYCTWPKFMKLPGSKTFAPGSLNYSDGYVGRITNELIRRPGKCKRSQD